MSDNKRNAGKLMMDHLATIGRAKRKAGTATTEELAAAAGIPVGQAYSRLWWMENKDGTIFSIGGKGNTKMWRLVPKRKPAKA